MLTTKPKKKTAFQTQHNPFSPVISYARSGPAIWVEKSFSYRNPSLSSRNHARRMALEGAKFLRVECEAISTGKIQWSFVFSVKQDQFERV